MHHHVVHEIKKGNRCTFGKVFDEYHVKLYQYIYKYTQSAWLAEETVQLTFIKLWEKREQLSEQYHISIQIFRIAKSLVIDLLRKESLRTTQQLSDTYISATNDHDRPLHKDQLEHILAAIEALPQQSRQVFKLSRLDDRSHKEIGAELSISGKTIEGHITKALRHIRKNLSFLF